jgi:aspartate/methionine/tyrosine aminotransferase
MSLLPRRDFALERYFARWEFTTKYMLGSSEVEGWSLADVLALADEETAAAWQSLTLGYTESAGLPLLRAEISGLYDAVSADDVIVCTGAQEAILLTLGTAVGPGDHVIVVTPCYQSLTEVASAAGADISTVRLEPADEWHLNLARVRAALRPNTRAIVVNFPHNPTGALPGAATWQALVDLAADAGARLVSDEVYRFMESDPTTRLPSAVDCAADAVSIGVMSKAFGLAGLRVGWIATRDPALRSRAAAARDYTTICGAAPSELLATIALRARDTVLRRNHALVQENLQRLDAFFSRHPDRFSWVPPRGGCVAFPRILDGEPVDVFADRLRRTEGVLVLPGTLFDDRDNHFRIGAGRRSMPDALAALQRFIAARPR